MEQYLQGKTALVTGAGWGIGAAAAMLYAAYGAKVIISDTSRKGGKDTVAKIRNEKGLATFIKTDVNSAPECKKLIKRTIDTYGSIDIACNNSAIFSELQGPADKNSKAAGNEMDLNLNGLHYCMKYEIEAMQKQGGGVIVNMSSILGAIGLGSLSPYINAKYGAFAFIQNPAGLYSATGIRIHVVTPAFINTALLEETNPTEKGRLVRLSSISSRPGMLQQVAGLAVWLSSDGALLPTVANDTN